jgi:hypothetical protein
MGVVWKLAGVAAVAAVAGCSSGGDGPGGDPNPPPTFGQMDQLGLKLAGEIEPLSYTDPLTLPASGSARYEGVIGLAAFELPDEDRDNAVLAAAVPDLVGQMRLDVEFADDAASGEARNFRTEKDEVWGGTLKISDVVIYRDTDVTEFPTYEGLIGGTLTRDGSTLEVDADLVGDFLGADAGYTAGEVYGGISDGKATYDLWGVFVAED